MIPIEDFYKIPEFPDYFISNNGTIISTKNNRIRFIKCRPSKDGYTIVNLYNKKPFTKKIHQLVAAVFLPKPKQNQQINHKDCNKINNNVSNLEWCTKSENMRHAYKNGLMENCKKAKRNNGGERSGQAKLNNATANILRNLYASSKHTQKELSNLFGICQTQVSAIILNKAYKNDPT